NRGWLINKRERTDSQRHVAHFVEHVRGLCQGYLVRNAYSAARELLERSTTIIRRLLAYSGEHTLGPWRKRVLSYDDEVREEISMQLTEDHTPLARRLAAGIEVDVVGDPFRELR